MKFKVKERARTFSMLDDFESGNTSLDDVIGFSDKRGSHFDFNDYLTKYATGEGNWLKESKNETRRFKRRKSLDFSKVTKTEVDEDEDVNTGLDADPDMSMDLQFRSNQPEKEDEEEEAMDFGEELKDFLDRTSSNGSQNEMEEIFEEPEEEFEELEFDNKEEEIEPSSLNQNNQDNVRVLTKHNPTPVKIIPSESPIHNQLNRLNRMVMQDDSNSSTDSERELEPGKFTDLTEPIDLADFQFTFSSPFTSRIQRPQIFADSMYYRENVGKSPGRVCSPMHRKTRPSRSNIRVRKNLLNLIVESSDGSLEDATKYATEINSQNSTGIPLPEKTTELVTIPTTGPQIGSIKKAAIVRATLARANVGEKKIDGADPRGFYSAGEKREFVKIKETSVADKENMIPRKKTQSIVFNGGARKRKVQWANDLVW